MLTSKQVPFHSVEISQISTLAAKYMRKVPGVIEMKTKHQEAEILCSNHAPNEPFVIAYVDMSFIDRFINQRTLERRSDARDAVHKTSICIDDIEVARESTELESRIWKMCFAKSKNVFNEYFRVIGELIVNGYGKFIYWPRQKDRIEDGLVEACGAAAIGKEIDYIRDRRR